ncbi:OmpA family protein [Marinobacter sp.]|uniref:OmpA family protein n=1 Tax=Marinobacter sp. TaxID=50741 RepID=UPI003BABDCBB
MMKLGCLCLILFSAGCGHFHPALADLPEQTRIEVTQARNISTHRVLAQDIDYPDRGGMGQPVMARQWVAPGCRLQFYTLNHSRAMDHEPPLQRYLNDGIGPEVGYLSTYQRHVIRSTFEPGTSMLSEALKADLEWFAQSLKANAVLPHVVVIGHASSRGSEGFNSALSEDRALNTTRYLILNGISPEHIHVVAAGESIPPAYDHPVALHERSRRVELATFIRAPEPRGGKSDCRSQYNSTVSIANSRDAS